MARLILQMSLCKLGLEDAPLLVANKLFLRAVNIDETNN